MLKQSGDLILHPWIYVPSPDFICKNATIKKSPNIFFGAILCALQYWPMQYTHKKERKKENKENNTVNVFFFWLIFTFFKKNLKNMISAHSKDFCEKKCPY